MEPAAITPESFTFVALFARADWVVKSVMILLGLASLASWGVILDKALRLRSLNRAADAFEAEAASGRSLEDIALEAGENPPHALHRMLQACSNGARPGPAVRCPRRRRPSWSRGSIAFWTPRSRGSP